MGTVYRTTCECIRSVPEPDPSEYYFVDDYVYELDMWRKGWEAAAGEHESHCPKSAHCRLGENQVRAAQGTGDTLGDEYQRALVKHASGDYYITASCSTWSDSGYCTGWRIVSAVGPLNLRDDLGVEGPLEPSSELFDRIDDAVNLSTEDASWLNQEDHEERLSYPVGAR